MPCGFCSENGHIMRNCNSSAAQNLLFNYRQECLIPRTDLELIRFLRSFTGDMLSIIMYSYGARSVSVTRALKEQFIREKILQARNQPALVIDLTAPIINQAQAGPNTPVGPPPALLQPAVLLQPAILQQPNIVRPVHPVNVLRESMFSYKTRMQIVADTLFDVVCITGYGITRYTNTNSAEFREMIVVLSECLIAETRNSVSESIFISKLIIKKFHLPRVITPVIKFVFLNSINRENARVNEIRITQMRAQGLLPPSAMRQPQVFVPHIPKFADIQLVPAGASEAEDYCCGICSDVFTKETLPTLGCNHTLCVVCITGQIKARTKSCIKCPYCREEVTKISIKNDGVRNQIHVLVTAEIAKN
jgi:hypothetical protein